MVKLPESLLYPLNAFADDFKATHSLGATVWRDADVAVVGLARNCDRWLAGNLARLRDLAGRCKSWRLHVRTNDNSDSTPEVLEQFCAEHSNASYVNESFNRPVYGAEFAGRRTQAMAEYRTACQEWVKENCPGVDFVVVIDLDMWGGWSDAGFIHGVGALTLLPNAFGVASVSLLQHHQLAMQASGEIAKTTVWMQYDCWALRLNSTFDDYSTGIGGWKHNWLPPVGSPPVPVCSAFGGMAIYETDAYLVGTYDGSDCEHVPFHATIAERTGRSLYLDPAMRTVMHWLEPTDGGQHGND